MVSYLDKTLLEYQASLASSSNSLLFNRLAIDIIFVALVVLAISISVIVFVRAISNVTNNAVIVTTTSDGKGPGSTPSVTRTEKSTQTRDGSNSSGTFSLTIADPDANAGPNSSSDQIPSPQTNNQYGGSLAPVLAGEQLVIDGNNNNRDPAQQVALTIYGSSPYILPITWGAVAGTLIWRGKVRSDWSRQGYDYDTFRLVAKMRGSSTRVKLLNLIDSPKNKLQLAKELQVDWKTIDNHIATLAKNKLVEEKVIVGAARYYVITENGRKILSLLTEDRTAVQNNNREQMSGEA